MKLNLPSKYHIATFIALLFHVSGCIGMFTDNAQWFIDNTPLNMILMVGLIFWTQPKINRWFVLFFIIAFTTGMIAEIIGVNTSVLFGEYEYGKVLGPKFYGVPWLIGVSWFVIIYCAGVVVSKFHDWIERKYEERGLILSPRVRLLSLVFDGALLATFFDFIMEPAAIKLGFWMWLGDGDIPFLNYFSWFAVSAILLAVFRMLRFEKHNQFAVHLFIIQLLFFGIIRTYL